jgi:plasmid maintenance system antidote protein VapI
VRQVLSKNLKLSRQYLSNIVNQKAGISADISMHLSKWALDKVSEKEAFRGN